MTTRTSKTAEKTNEKSLNIRVDSEMIAALDAYATELSEQTGLAVSRSDLARKIIRDALSARAPQDESAARKARIKR